MKRLGAGGMMATLFGVIVLIAFVGCSFTTTTGPRLGISNASSESVTLAVNGARIADYPTGTTVSPIAPSLLPGLPWKIEIRGHSGVQLLLLSVTTSDHSEIASNSGNCGTVTLWTGSDPSTLPTALPDSSPGEPCSP